VGRPDQLEQRLDAHGVLARARLGVAAAVAGVATYTGWRGRAFAVLGGLGSVAAAVACVAVSWPPLDPAVYTGYSASAWPQRPAPWRTVDTTRVLHADVQRGGRVEAALARFPVSRGLRPERVYRALTDAGFHVDVPAMSRERRSSKQDRSRCSSS
jgi:hypothetical protein